MSKKLTAVIGILFLIFIVVGGAVGMFLLTRPTDNRSQAATAPAAQFNISAPRTEGGFKTRSLAVDTSRLRSGTTVSRFSVELVFIKKTLALPADKPMPGQGTQAQMAKPFPSLAPTSPIAMTSCRSNTDCPPNNICVKLAQPTCPPGQVCSAVVPRSYCQPLRVTITPSPKVTPVPNILAKSKDGLVTVKGVGLFRSIPGLSVTITSTADKYQIVISGQADSRNLALQKAFSASVPMLEIVTQENQFSLVGPQLSQISIKGFLPGLLTEVELTQPVPSNPPPTKFTPTPAVTNSPPKFITPTPPRTTPPPTFITPTAGATPQPALSPTPIASQTSP